MIIAGTFNLPRPDFWNDAACRGQPLYLFFPGKGRSGDPAKQICADCPVVQQCFDFAMADHGLCGVFGGTTEGERDRLRARARVA